MTLEEFLKLPETEPASEYIDGQIIQKPMPEGEHSTIQGELINDKMLVESNSHSEVGFLQETRLLNLYDF